MINRNNCCRLNVKLPTKVKDKDSVRAFRVRVRIGGDGLGLRLGSHFGFELEYEEVHTFGLRLQSRYQNLRTYI